MHIRIIFITISLLISQIGLAAVDTSIERYLKDLNLEEASKFDSVSSEINMGFYIPTKMRATSSENDVAEKIFGHTIDSAFNSAAFKNSAAGKTTHDIHSKLNPSIVMKSSDNKVHKIDMKFRALNQQAQLVYQGDVTVAATYQVTTDAYSLRLNKQLNKDTSVGYIFSDTGADQLNKVSLNWNW